MKKLFTTIVMLAVALSGWSQLSSTWDAATGTLTINYEGGKLDKPTLDRMVGGPAEGREGNVQKLVLEGVWANADINNDDFMKFVYEKCLGNKANQNYNGKTLYLDLEACSNIQCKKTGLNDAGTKFTYEPVDGTQQVTTTFTYRKKTTYTYTYYGDQVANIPNPDDHGWEGTINPFNGDANTTGYIKYQDGAWVIIVPNWGNQVIPLDLTPKTTWYDITDGEPGVEVVEYLDENSLTATDDPNIFTKSVTENIQVSAFSLSKTRQYINGITFPANDNFTLIPEQLFYFDNSNVLTTVVLPNNIEAIEREAFKNCTALNDITWSTGLQYIGLDNCEEKSKGSFEGCTALTAIDLSNTSLIEIGRNAFTNTSAATSLDLPASLQIIGPEAFHGSGITSVDLNVCKDNLWKLNYECFEDCYDLATVTFPEGDVLTYIGNDAFHSCTSLGSVDMHLCTGITEFQARADAPTVFKTFNNCTSLTSVILPPNLTAIPDDDGDGVFFGCNAMEYVEFTGTAIYDGCDLQNPLTIGRNAFKGFTQLATIKLSNNVQSIAYQAFHSAAITEIHIPASVEYLAKHSFYGCQQLANVYFDKFNVEGSNCTGAETFIAGDDGAQGNGAFEECQHITDVYVFTDALLHCQNNAFDQDITWGAGDVEGNFATLHYPKDNIDNYVNRKHYLTDAIVANPGLFHLWLHEHYDLAGEPNKNGWYEFINVGPFDPQNEEECQKIILRTFSDYKYNYLVPNGLRAYVVSDIHPLDGDYEVTLTRIRVIPKQTGVILYGHPNGKTSTGEPTLVLTPVEFAEAGEIIQLDGGQTVTAGNNEGLPLCRKNWENNYVKNYLEPILSEDGTAVEIKPYEKENGVVTFRNFALGRYTSTDYNEETPLDKDENNYVGFFRMKPQSYKSGYAYLRLSPNDGFDVADGGEIFVKSDTEKDLQNGVLSYSCEYKLTDGKAFDAAEKVGSEDNPKGWWNKNAVPVGFYWDEYSMSWGDHTRFPHGGAAKYFGEFEENADGIVKLVIPNENAKSEYYTLQGVKVTNPTKGVYILNGKKVIVK